MFFVLTVQIDFDVNRSSFNLPIETNLHSIAQIERGAVTDMKELRKLFGSSSGRICS